MKIIIGSAISTTPYSPGKEWHRFQYVHGLQKLGHDVYFLEQVSPSWCLDTRGNQVPLDQSINRKIFETTMERFSLVGKACQIYDAGQATWGLTLREAVSFVKDADLLFNWSGHINADCVLSHIKRRVYLDADPVYTQLWHSEYGVDLGFQNHDAFISLGLNIGTDYTTIPDCGITWNHTLPPLVLDHWPTAINLSCKRFTTVASLRSFGDLQYRGEWYQSKHEEFKRYAKLPRLLNQEFEIAVNHYREEEWQLGELRKNGWVLCDARQIHDLSEYRRYVGNSRAEIGIAQHAYVKGNSGWFSDRWSHYLATGKPVLAQATGFERHLPTGRGILDFSNVEEAAEGVHIINEDYAGHCRAAREFAEEFLDYRKTLPMMLEAVTST